MPVYHHEPEDTHQAEHPPLSGQEQDHSTQAAEENEDTQKLPRVRARRLPTGSNPRLPAGQSAQLTGSTASHAALSLPDLPVRHEIIPAPRLPIPQPSSTGKHAVVLQPSQNLPQLPLVSGEYTPIKSTATALRWQRHRKILLRHMSRKHMRSVREDASRNRRRLWLTLGSTVIAILVIFLSVTTAASYTAYRFASDTQNHYIPQVTTLRDLLPKDNLKMYDSKGVLIGQKLDQGSHTAVKLDQVSKYLVNATVAVEDKNFWDNPGIDITRIIQAALDNLRSGHVVEGGSTITQQLIKNLVVGNETSIVRKLEEVVLTPSVNSHYSKNDIMEMYLDSIYYGEQAYGVDAAATAYYGLEDQPGKPAAMQLDLAQAAMLAGIPSSPDAYDPYKHPQAAYNRFTIVLDALKSQGYITRAQYNDAREEAQRPGFLKHPHSYANRAPHFFNFVLTQLQQIYHLKHQDLSRSDMRVYTTLDITLQDKIQKIMQDHIAQMRDTHNIHNAAEVLIDFHNGAVRSLLGSIDYNDTSIDGQYDVATLGYRQPGSSFKPYVYVTAFEQGASPAQAVSDQVTTYYLPDSNPPTYTPLNYDKSVHGHMTIRCALQNSLNIPAVRTLQHVGIDAAMKTAKDMGITSYQGSPGLSLVLGGLDVHLIDHTSAYGTFANGGVHVPYYTVDKVVFASTGQTYGHKLDPGKRVLDPRLAYMITSVLSDNEDRLPEFYDCNVLQLYSNSQDECYAGNRGSVRPAAAKTGTTNDFRDNWTMGYTTDFVMGVWAGNDDNSSMLDATGVLGAAPIWHDSMLLAEQGHPIRDFPNPGGLQWAKVTYPDGVQSSDWFIPGTVPTFNKMIMPTPSATVSVTPTPDPNNPTQPVKQINHGPWCPSFSYAFPPPPDNVPSPIPGWW